jgi:streptogramin lyase
VNIYKYFVFFHLLFASITGFSQNQSLKFEHIGVKEGLSQINITCIKQDSRGFIWIGTRDGLNRYDGYKFTIYRFNAADDNTISNNFIQDIVEDKSGCLWIATQGGGINKYEIKRDRFTRYLHNNRDLNSISGNTVNKLVLDETNKLWIATERAGLDCFDLKKKQFTHNIHSDYDVNSISDNNVKALLQDAAGNLWVGTANGGLNRLNKKNNNFSRFEHDDLKPETISGNTVSAIFEDKDHHIWIGTQGNGLNLFDPIKGSFIHYKHDEKNVNSLAGSNVLSINEDDGGNLWVGVENGGIGILQKRTVSFIIISMTRLMLTASMEILYIRSVATGWEICGQELLAEVLTCLKKAPKAFIITRIIHNPTVYPITMYWLFLKIQAIIYGWALMGEG